MAWDTSHPRKISRGDWDTLPEDVEIVLNDIFNAINDTSTYLSYKEIQDLLYAKGRDLWVREAKNLIVDSEDDSIQGVAEYMGAMTAFNAIRDISERYGEENVIDKYRVKEMNKRIESVENDYEIFLDQCEDQIDAGDVVTHIDDIYN